MQLYIYVMLMSTSFIAPKKYLLYSLGNNA